VQGEFDLRAEDGTVLDWLFMSMAYKQLNDSAAAQKWLNQAREGFERDASVSWVMRAELEMLLSEAADLVESPGREKARH